MTVECTTECPAEGGVEKKPPAVLSVVHSRKGGTLVGKNREEEEGRW